VHLLGEPDALLAAPPQGGLARLEALAAAEVAPTPFLASTASVQHISAARSISAQAADALSALAPRTASVEREGSIAAARPAALSSLAAFPCADLPRSVSARPPVCALCVRLAGWLSVLVCSLLFSSFLCPAARVAGAWHAPSAQRRLRARPG
jgi:hypothetical protein